MDAEKISKLSVPASIAGGLIGATAVVVLSAQQINVAEHWATIIAAVCAVVGGLALAFKAALGKK